jgi:hypothetical protein
LPGQWRKHVSIKAEYLEKELKFDNSNKHIHLRKKKNEIHVNLESFSILGLLETS